MYRFQKLQARGRVETYNTLKQVTLSASLVLAPPSRPKEIDSKVQRWSQVTELTGSNN